MGDGYGFLFKLKTKENMKGRGIPGYIAQFLGEPERSCLRGKKETWKQSNAKTTEFEISQSFLNHPRWSWLGSSIPTNTCFHRLLFLQLSVEFLGKSFRESLVSPCLGESIIGACVPYLPGRLDPRTQVLMLILGLKFLLSFWQGRCSLARQSQFSLTSFLPWMGTPAIYTHDHDILLQ